MMTYEDALRMTNKEAWGKLSEEGKVEVLQALENKAALDAGRNARTVTDAWLYTGNDGIELGLYSPGEDKIFVNSSQLVDGSYYGNNPDKMAETVLHEGRHAFQHDVANGVIEYDDEETAKEWSNNLSPGGYVKFSENPRAYYNQPVEKDAREFAANRLGEMQDERAALAERDAQEAAKSEGASDWLDAARDAFSSGTSDSPSTGSASESAGADEQSSVVQRRGLGLGR